jgi:hypothetical protein
VTGHLDGHIRVWLLEYGKEQQLPQPSTTSGLLGLTSGTMGLMASPLVTAAVPDEDDEEDDEEEEDEDDEEAAAMAEGASASSAGNASNCLTLVHELSYCPAACPSLPSRAPITALTMAPDMRRFASGDAAGVVCLWTATATATATAPATTGGAVFGHTPVASNAGMAASR